MKARIRQIWHVALLLALQLLILQAQELTESPEKLAARIVDDSCKADNFTSFYLQIRDSHEVARKYPVWPNGKSIKTELVTADFYVYFEVCKILT